MTETVTISFRQIPIDYIASELFNILSLIGYLFFFILLLFTNFEAFLFIKKYKKGLSDIKKNM